ncbi:nucleotidyltransferase domain-containing protein [Algibacter lectus]|uniref:Nucleotidyltransferase-like n=1 Tax=Algibacter lectus TaxID=221126 RepID=A0A090VP05_9FLAO|nr:nucleotidyltransferase domain-containing protein [Algibacter lectus]GAL65029.1 nucleotidyltransferase-like [Algibacter lectus]
MKEEIRTLFENRTELPLFYVESGSRLWGIASPDSDYDVRGFHLQSKEQYFDFKKHRDLIEIMDGDFDFVSYDIDKMFGLLAKSNPTVFEWIRAHIIYFNNLPNWDKMQNEIIKNFDFKALYYHYLSLAKGNINLMETDKKFTYKTAFYCIRGLLSAELATKKIIPELLIDKLFEQFETENEVIKIAKESLEKKKSKTEKEDVELEKKPILLSKIKAYAQELDKNVPEPSNNPEKLKTILRDYSFELKNHYYG